MSERQVEVFEKCGTSKILCIMGETCHCNTLGMSLLKSIIL